LKTLRDKSLIALNVDRN